MLPLETLHIHRFRGLEEVELRDLGRFNVLVGRNNSGKSTILEAIATHARPLRPSEWVEVVRRRDAALIEGLLWLFPQSEQQAPSDPPLRSVTHISTTGSFVVHGSRADLSEVEGAFEDVEEGPQLSLPGVMQVGVLRGAMLTLHATLDGERWETPTSAVFWEGRRIPTPLNQTGPTLPIATITPFTHRMQRDVEVLSDALFVDLKPKLIELVQVFDPEIEDLEILKRPRSETAVYLRRAGKGKAPLSTFGDGMRRVLLMGVSLASVRGGILLVDEIESAIHVEALDASFRWLQRACRELDVQLFATTHSLEAVDALIAAADGVDDLVAYRLEQKDGKVRAKRFSSESLRVLREELGQEIRA